MIVDFYQIRNCRYEFYRGRHVIFAPNNISEALLYTYRFFRTEDGRACHFLTPDEYYHVMNNMSTGRAVFGIGNQMPINRASVMMLPVQEEKNVTTLCFISLALLVASFVLFAFISDNTYSNAIGELLGVSFTCFIVSFILSIVARSRNKKSVFALVLLILHIILTVLVIIGIVMAMITCGQAIDSCIDSFN